MSKTKIRTGLSFEKNEYSSFSLSYVGDAFYELWCRQEILRRMKNRRQIHKKVVQWVRCQTQASLVHMLMPHLTIKEEKI